MDILGFLVNFFSNYGYFAVFASLIICGFGFPLPEDITLIAGGVICSVAENSGFHLLNIHLMVIVALSGVLTGDCFIFLLGKYLGHRVHQIFGLRHIFTPSNYKKMQLKAHKYGNKILFMARFLPGLRVPIFITAGISHRVSFIKFILMDGAGAIISVPLWVYIGYWFASDLDQVIYWAKKSEVFIVAIILILLIVFFLYRKHKNKIKHKDD